MMNEKDWTKASYLHEKGLVDFGDNDMYELSLEFVPSIVNLAKDYIENVLGGTPSTSGKYYITIFNSTEGLEEIIDRAFCYDIPKEMLDGGADNSYLVALPKIFDYGYEHNCEYCINIFKSEEDAKKYIELYEENEMFLDICVKEDVSPELKLARRAEYRRTMKKYREINKESR